MKTMVWSPVLNLSWLADEAGALPDLTFALSKMTSNSVCSILSRPIPETVDNLSKRFVGFSKKWSEKIDIQSTTTYVKTYAKERPVLLVLLVIIAVIICLPLVAFVTFVVATLGFTFMGFLFVEGTLLTVGTFFLSGMLFFVGFMAIGFSAFVAASWYIVNKTFNVIQATTDVFNMKPAIKPTLANGLHHYD